MNVAIIILAAGSSSRMGTPKQLLQVGENTLLGIVVKNALESKANTIYCVLGDHSEKIIKSLQEYNVQIIINSNYKNGLSSSIVKGIEHIEPLNFDAALIILGDQPLINASFINTLIESFYKNPLYITASNYIKNIGVPAIFPSSYFNELQKLKGDKGAKELLNSKIAPVNIITAHTNLMDIDTYEEYLKFKSIQKI